MSYLIADPFVRQPTTGVPGGFGGVAMGDAVSTFRDALKRVMEGVKFVDQLSAQWPASKKSFPPAMLLELIGFCASVQIDLLNQTQRLRDAHFLLSNDIANIERGLIRRFDDLHVKPLIQELKAAKKRGDEVFEVPPGFRDAMIRYWIEVKSAFFAIDHFKSTISTSLLGATVGVFSDVFAGFVVKMQPLLKFVQKLIDKVVAAVPGIPDVGKWFNLMMWGSVAAGGLWLLAKRRSTSKEGR